MNTLMNYLLGSTSYVGSISEISDQLLKVLFNPLQYIVSCVWYPFSIIPDETGNLTKLDTTPIGWWELDVPCYQLNTTLKYFTSTVPVTKHPQAASRGEYLNKQPFTTYTLYYPGVGSIVLDPSLITTDNVVAQCAVDLIANQARLTISSSGLVSVQYSQIGVPIQLAQMAEQSLSMIGDFAKGATSVASSAAKGDVFGALGNVFDMVGNAVNHAYPQTTVASSNGSIVGLSYTVQLKTICYRLVDEDNADLGRPLCKVRKISDVPGYQMIMHADVTIAGTREENQMIKDYMESGYFYE